MADNDKGGPQYSGQDMARMLNDLMYGDEGMLANTILSLPREPYAQGLDRTVYTAEQTKKDYFDRYLREITRVPTLNRQKGLAAASGLGDKLMSTMDTLFEYSPSAVMDLMQHHGGDQAAAEFLNMSNGIAAARGAGLGGLGSPRQQADNMRFAASQGALAYRNNFNSDGTINTDQTHGVNLPIAAMISGKAMSDRSQYTSWADRMNKKGSDLSKDELELDPREIDNFINGVGTTARAEKSFNEQIKKFSEGINKFVASVSRMTGDYVTAIEFLQKATGDKLFSAGENAARAREQASKLVYGMRIAAADAGIDQGTMAAMAQQFAYRADFASGHDERTSILNRNPINTRMGALAATGMAKWQQQNPNATDLDRARAGMAMEDRVDNYMKGDAYKLNTIAAYMADSGLLDKDEWNDVAKSGNARLMFNHLAERYGGADRIRGMMDDSRQLEMISMNHADTAFEFHNSTFAGGGIEQEMMRMGSRNLFNTAKHNFASEQTVERENQIQKLEKDMGVSRKGLMLDKDILQKADISDPEQIQKLIDDANKYNYTADEILSRVDEYGGDRWKLEEAVSEKMISEASSKYGKDSKQVKLLKSPKDAYEMDKRMNEIERESMLDDTTLEAAGIKDEARKKKLQDEARKGEWSADTIREYITNVEHGNVAYADMVSNQLTYSKVAEEFGEDSPAVKNFKKGIDRIQGATSIDKAQKEAYSEIMSRGKSNELESIKSAIKSEKDPSKRSELQRVLNTKVEQGLDGSNGYMTTDNDYIETLLTEGLKDKKLSPEEQKTYIESAKKVFNGAIAGGASVNAAFDMIKTTEGLGDKFEDDFDSSDNRKEAFDKARSRHAIAATTRKFVKEAGINLSSEELESKMLEAYRLFDEEKGKNPEADDETLMAQVLRPVFKDQIGDKEKTVEPLLKELQEGKGSLYETMEKASTQFKSDSVKADKSSFIKQYEKAVSSSRMDTISDAAIKAYEKDGAKIDSEKYAQTLKKLQEDPETKGLKQEEIVKRAIEETTGEKAAGDVAKSIERAALGFDTDNDNLIKLLEPAMQDQKDAMTLGEIGKKLGVEGDALTGLVAKTQTRMEDLKKKNPELSTQELRKQAVTEVAKENGIKTEVSDELISDAEKSADKKFKQTVAAEAERLIIDKAHSGDNLGTIYGYAAGENSVQAFHTNANTAMLKNPVQESAAAIFGGNIAKVVEEQDELAVKDAYRPVASFTGENLKRIERQLNVTEKMKALDATKDQLLTSVVDDKGNRLDGEQDLAKAFSAFNDEKKGSSDSDYMENFKKRFGDEGLAELTKLQESSGISMREAVASIGAGKDETDDEKRKSKEKAAYIDEHIKNGAPELSKDQEVAGYLSKLVDLTDQIAKQQADGNRALR